jgi:hypothetical protein
LGAKPVQTLFSRWRTFGVESKDPLQGNSPEPKAARLVYGSNPESFFHSLTSIPEICFRSK